MLPTFSNCLRRLDPNLSNSVVAYKRDFFPNIASENSREALGVRNAFSYVDIGRIRGFKPKSLNSAKMFATWQIIEENRQGAMKINSGTAKWCNEKKFFLKFGIISIGDGKLHFYWFDFLSPTVVKISEFSKVKLIYHRW